MEKKWRKNEIERKKESFDGRTQRRGKGKLMWKVTDKEEQKEEKRKKNNKRKRKEKKDKLAERNRKTKMRKVKNHMKH